MLGLDPLDAPDTQLVEVAVEQGATSLTLDLDFGRIFVERE